MMRPIFLGILTLILAGVVSYYVTTQTIQANLSASSEVIATTKTTEKPSEESVYDRVMRTGKVRCGYWVSPPLIIKDLNTGELSGAYVDYVNMMGDALDLDIEWTAEINLGTYLEDLNTGKFDLECATGWPNALRGKLIEYATPVGYLPIFVYSKADNKKFDGHLDLINDPEVRFAAHDGGTNALIQASNFPKSKLVGISGDMSSTEPFDMIRYGKADVTAYATFEGNQYIQANPNSVRKVQSDPLRVIPLCLGVPMNEFRLLNMLNTATTQLLNDGTLDLLYDKYEIDKRTIHRVAKPYEGIK